MTVDSSPAERVRLGSIALDKGKTLIVRQTARSDMLDADGWVKVFFGLNGQPRLMRIQKAGVVVAGRNHPKIDETNHNHVGTPMPGAVVTVAVHVGQKVSRGSPLVSLEAMKMETMLAADRDAVVKHSHVKTGDKVAAKDLLVELEGRRLPADWSDRNPASPPRPWRRVAESPPKEKAIRKMAWGRVRIGSPFSSHCLHSSYSRQRRQCSGCRRPVKYDASLTEAIYGR